MTNTNPSFPLPDPRNLPADVGDLLAGLVDHLPELVAVVSGDGRVLWCNAAVEEVIGWERSHWIGRSILDVLHPDDVLLARELLVSARSTGPGAKEPVTYRMASAYEGWVTVEVVASSVELASGRTVLVTSARLGGIARESGSIAQEVADRLSRMFDASTLGMAQVRLDGTILRVNQRFAELADRPAVSLIDADLPSLVHALDDRSLLDAPLGELVAASERSWTIRFGRDGGRDVQLSASLIRDWQGAPMYVAVHATDVTELLARDRARRAGELQLRAALELVADGVVFLDAAHVVREANDRARQLLAPEGELIGRSLLDLVDDAAGAALVALSASDRRGRLDVPARTTGPDPRTVMLSAALAAAPGLDAGSVVMITEPNRS